MFFRVNVQFFIIFPVLLQLSNRCYSEQEAPDMTTDLKSYHISSGFNAAINIKKQARSLLYYIMENNVLIVLIWRRIYCCPCNSYKPAPDSLYPDRVWGKEYLSGPLDRARFFSLLP